MESRSWVKEGGGGGRGQFGCGREGRDGEGRGVRTEGFDEGETESKTRKQEGGQLKVRSPPRRQSRRENGRRDTNLIAPVAFPASLASALVCSSLHPLNEMTSAAEVLVLRVFSVPDPPEETCLKVDWRPVFERKRGERRGQSPVRQDEKKEQEKEGRSTDL